MTLLTLKAVICRFIATLTIKAIIFSLTLYIKYIYIIIFSFFINTTYVYTLNYDFNSHTIRSSFISILSSYYITSVIYLVVKKTLYTYTTR